MPKKSLKKWTTRERERGQKNAAAWQEFFARRRDEVEHAEEIEATAEVGATLDRHEDEILGLPNVTGVGASVKETGGKPTGEVSLTVFVERKVARKKLGDDSVPREIDGIATDVVVGGKLEPLASFSKRIRPAMPGYSIGHSNVTAGTFGCLVRDLESPTQRYLLLGNNHVLADTNRGRLGDPILQPGPYDGGDDAKDTVAILERFEPIHFADKDGGFGDDDYNLVDAAVARPVSSRQVTASVIGSMIPQGVGQAFLGDRVLKAGRTSGVTRGRVVSVNATVVVWFPEGPARFRHQILTTFMSMGGDSGSLLMDRHLSAVGLVFAGSPFLTVASHIADVEAALGVRTLTAPRQRSGVDSIRRQIESGLAREQPAPPPDEDDDGPQPSPPPDEDDGGPQPSPPPDEDDGGPQPAPPPDEDDAGPQPAPPPDEDDAGPQPVG